MKIYTQETQQAEQELLGLMEQAAQQCMKLEGFSEEEIERTEISLSFVSPEEIHALNRQYRQVDRPTDVLSFPQFDDLNDLPQEGELCLGDVVICTAQAKVQAAEYGHSERREMLYLFVHSVLHLLGYDHMEEDEKRQMRKREEEVMEKLGLSREVDAK